MLPLFLFLFYYGVNVQCSDIEQGADGWLIKFCPGTALYIY